MVEFLERRFNLSDEFVENGIRVFTVYRLAESGFPNEMHVGSSVANGNLTGFINGRERTLLGIGVLP